LSSFEGILIGGGTLLLNLIWAAYVLLELGW